MSTSKEPLARPKAGAAATRVDVAKRTPAAKAAAAVAYASARNKLLLHAVTGVSSGDRPAMLVKIRRGLPFDAITRLEKGLAVPRKELAELLSIPVSTLTRRKKSGRLQPDESDRVARLARLKDAAVDMMQGDDNAAVQWLHTPLDILGNESPMVHASTEMGARDVEDLIGRIGHGVFS